MKNFCKDFCLGVTSIMCKNVKNPMPKTTGIDSFMMPLSCGSNQDGYWVYHMTNLPGAVLFEPLP
jgi:hypothetical protein